MRRANHIILVMIAALVALLGSADSASGGLIAYYPMDGNANDAGPNGLHGTISGAVPAADRFGNPSGALLFDGINDYVELPASEWFSTHVPGTAYYTGVIRISAWIKVLAVNTDGHPQARQPVVSLGGPPSEPSGTWAYAMYVFDSGAAGSSIWQQNGTGHTEISGGTIPLNTWVFLEIEYKYQQFNRVWLNGTLVKEATGPFNGEPGLRTSIGPWIGARRDGQYLNAVIDDVRFWSHPTPEPATMGSLLCGVALTALRLRDSRRRRVRSTGDQ